MYIFSIVEPNYSHVYSSFSLMFIHYFLQASNGKLTEVMIGTIGISSKTNWDALDSVVRRIFKVRKIY